ncbi:hypothetical protein [Hyphomicrobium sp.]|uniref:hypothetical protein n=1 Tax=Hyphomicrobium sp. TaxID=82 RepID=UPI001DD4534E|nr:hypothetical protein [Hyphomicrobium sp.]MBY0560364.1 DUF2846 domain-containing protein [Hyphomicrobium sp.]
MRHLKFIGVVLIGAILAGCGSHDAENAGLAKMPLRTSDARLKIYRTDALESAGDAARVKIDGREVASLGSGGSTMLDVPAGLHKIVVDTPLHPNVYEISLATKAGAHYALEVSPRSAATVARMFGVVGMLAESAANQNGGEFQIRVVEPGEKT